MCEHCIEVDEKYQNELKNEYRQGFKDGFQAGLEAARKSIVYIPTYPTTPVYPDPRPWISPVTYTTDINTNINKSTS